MKNCQGQTSTFHLLFFLWCSFWLVSCSGRKLAYLLDSLAQWGDTKSYPGTTYRWSCTCGWHYWLSWANSLYACACCSTMNHACSRWTPARRRPTYFVCWCEQPEFGLTIEIPATEILHSLWLSLTNIFITCV